MSTGITVFFPCYGDAGTIASMVVLAERTVRDLTDDWEIVVVDDCSPDHAGEVLEELRAHFPRLRVVTHPSNRGYGGALRSGFEAATKELIFYTDGDAQYDPRELRRLYERLTPGVEVVNGYKLFRGDGPVRALVGRCYHLLVSVAFGLRIRDVDCDFRLIRRAALEGVELESTSGTVCVELIKKLQDRGARFAEVGVNHYDRPFGSSQFFRPKRLVQTLWQLAALWWRLIVRPRQGVAPAEVPATEP